MIKVIKFSDLPEIKGKYKNIELLNDKVIAIESIPFYGDDCKMTENQIDYIINIVKDYEVIIVNDCEHIYIDGWIELLNRLNNLGKIIFLTTFTVGIKKYIDKCIPNNNILIQSIKEKIVSLLLATNQTDITSINDIDTTIERKFNIKFFSYNRTPGRDYVIDYLIKNDLIKDNCISFHNYGNDDLDENCALWRTNSLYKFNKVNTFLKNVDLKLLNKLKIIPESQNFNIQNQDIQFEENEKSSLNSYFEIVCESQIPFSEDIENSFYYTYSISRRLLTPILFRNAIHIMPNSKLFCDDLKKEGIELFFESDEDFKNKCNKDFYFAKETQEKIHHNFSTIKKWQSEIDYAFFYIKELQNIYGINLMKNIIY